MQKYAFQKKKSTSKFSSLCLSLHISLWWYWKFQISSMIEIEVEMDTDVLAAEAASNAVHIFDFTIAIKLIRIPYFNSWLSAIVLAAEINMKSKGGDKWHVLCIIPVTYCNILLMSAGTNRSTDRANYGARKSWRGMFSVIANISLLKHTNWKTILVMKKENIFMLNHS